MKLIYNLIIKISALLVQLVERRFPKPDVVGSSPTGRVLNVVFILLLSHDIFKYKYGEVAEWLKASDC